PIEVIWENEDISETVFIVFNNFNETGFSVIVNDKELGNYNFGSNITSEFGDFKVNKLSSIELNEIQVNMFPKIIQAENFQRNLNIAPTSKTSSVVELSIIDHTPEKAADFL